MTGRGDAGVCRRFYPTPLQAPALVVPDLGQTFRIAIDRVLR